MKDHMENPESKKDTVKVTYSDGESLDVVSVDAGESGEETVTNVLGSWATAMNRAISNQVDSNPEYVAARKELASTAWFRFKRRKKLAEYVSKLHSDAFVQAISGVVEAIEVVDIAEPNSEAE